MAGFLLPRFTHAPPGRLARPLTGVGIFLDKIMTISKVNAEKAAATAKRVAQAAAIEAKRLADALEKPAEKLLARLGALQYSGITVIGILLAVFGAGLLIGCK